MLSYKIILKKVKENIEEIKKYGVQSFGIFGSYVTGEYDKQSDIDVLVKFKQEKKTFDNYMDLKFFLEDLFKCKVDLVISETIRPELKPYILKNVKYASNL